MFYLLDTIEAIYTHTHTPVTIIQKKRKVSQRTDFALLSGVRDNDVSLNTY